LKLKDLRLKEILNPRFSLAHHKMNTIFSAPVHGGVEKAGIDPVHILVRRQKEGSPLLKNEKSLLIGTEDQMVAHTGILMHRVAGLGWDIHETKAPDSPPGELLHLHIDFVEISMSELPAEKTEIVFPRKPATSLKVVEGTGTVEDGLTVLGPMHQAELPTFRGEWISGIHFPQGLERGPEVKADSSTFDVI
jgi:hypothetical protein